MKPFAVLFALIAANAAAVYGCSADANNPVSDGDSGAVATGGDDSGVLTDDATVDDATVEDTGKKDAGKDTGKDTSSDAISDANKFDAPVSDGAPQGTPCQTPQAVEAQTCGLCGVQYRGCLATGTDSYAWGPWGFCQNEVTGPDACDPNQNYTDEACGNCGTRPRLCQNDCHFATGLVCNEPANSCHPGDTEFVLGLSCDAGGREHTCGTTCQWGPYGNCTTGPVNSNFINIATTAGGIATKKFTMPNLPAANKLSRLGTGSCPTTISTSSKTNYLYVQVNNTTSKAATVSIYGSKATGGTDIDTVMGVYAGAIPPNNADDTARKACMTGTDVNDSCGGSCSGATGACSGQWAGLCADDMNTITIPAGGSVTVYNAEYFSTGTGGDFNMSVRTETLN